MAAFDDALNHQNPQIPLPIPDPNRMAFLEGQFQYLFAEVTHLRGMVNNPPPPPPPPPPFRPNLNLPHPPQFSGTPSELPTFKLKLFQFLMGNHNTYQDSESQLMFAGSLLVGSAGQWYLSLIDPATTRLPPSYTIDSFIQDLEDFFGGGNTLQSRERALDVLRQTGSVSELAIAFQNLTSTFIPRWSDHPLIYVFSKKLKEVIRFELTARGSLPTTFQAYVAVAISVEQNQAAAALSRSHGSSNPPPAPPRLSLTVPPLPLPPLVPSPWMWMVPALATAPSPRRNVVAGRTPGFARTVVRQTTRLPLVLALLTYARPGAPFPTFLRSQPLHPVISTLQPVMLTLPGSPTPRGPSQDPGTSSLTPKPQPPPPPPPQPLISQKTPTPASRSLAGRYSPLPHPSLPLSHPLPPFPHGAPPRTWSAAHSRGGAGRLRGL